jgi:hypothetical protein
LGPYLDTTLRIGEVAFLGVNSVDPQAHQRGRFDAGRLARVVARLSALAPGTLKVVVLHHPLVHPAGSDKAPMPGAQAAATALSAAGADLVLSGHLHSWGAAVFPVPNAASMLYVQAGTGLSTRLRGEPNDFNLVVCRAGEAQVTRFAADAKGGAFLPQREQSFRDGPGGWVRV